MRDGAGARWEVGGVRVRVSVLVNGRDLVPKRPAMDHLPSAKVPPLTGSGHVLRCELGRARVEEEESDGSRLSASRRKRRETQRDVISSLAAHTKCTRHPLVTYTAARSPHQRC